MRASDTAVSDLVEYRVRSWLARFVVNLNLCPFARPLVTSDALRVVVCEAEQREAIAEAFVTELALIGRASEADIATTLLVLPRALGQFDAYLDFVGDAEALLEEMGLSGVIQLASFHPLYQFAGEPPDSLGHFTNRAPYPLIHFLREDMVTQVLETYPNPERIPERNIDTLTRMGRGEVERLMQALDD